jgi:hypothetical protein
MKKKIFLTLGTVIFLAIFAGWYIRSKVHVVDPRPCIDIAKRYYSAMEVKSQEIFIALNFFPNMRTNGVNC